MDAANTALVDFCRAFWSWLDKQRSAENVFSIERVGGELRAGSVLTAAGSYEPLVDHWLVAWRLGTMLALV